MINAWNPLQIPSIKPSLLVNKSFTASAILGFLNTVAMNFAEPSGSSPALNPPGIITICEDSISLTIVSIESSILA